MLDRHSSASITRIAALSFCLMLPAPLVATSPSMLAAILFVFGASNGAMDVSMNAHGVAVERTLARPIMSSLHGGWSSADSPSAGSSLSPRRRGRPRVESLVVGVVLWLAALWITRRLWSSSATRRGKRVCAALACRDVDRRLCFLVMMTEARSATGADLLRHDAAQAPRRPRRRSPAFSLGMAVARLGGDTLNEHLGVGRLLRVRDGVGGHRTRGTLVTGSTVPAVIGFALCGLGIANAVPLLFSAAGRLEPPVRRSPQRSRSGTPVSSSGRRSSASSPTASACRRRLRCCACCARRHGARRTRWGVPTRQARSRRRTAEARHGNRGQNLLTHRPSACSPSRRATEQVRSAYSSRRAVPSRSDGSRAVAGTRARSSTDLKLSIASREEPAYMPVQDVEGASRVGAKNRASRASVVTPVASGPEP